MAGWEAPASFSLGRERRSPQEQGGGDGGTGGMGRSGTTQELAVSGL